MVNYLQKELRVSIIQHPPVYMNLRASIEKAGHLSCQASSEGAMVVVFPETWLPGYPVWLDSSPNAALWGYEPTRKLYRTLVDNSITIPGKPFDSLRKIAGDNGVYLVMGCHELVGHTLYNSMLYLFPDGQGYSLHRKIMPTYTEKLIWGMADGSTLNSVKTDFGILGGLICWEHWMPLARALMHEQGEVLHIAQWPAVKDLHQIASRHYAFEGQCFVAAAGTVLTKTDVLEGFDSLPGANPAAREVLQMIACGNDGLLQNGGSTFIRPDSTHLTKPLFEKNSIITANLDLEEIKEGHLLMDTRGHYSRPDIFELKCNFKKQVNLSSDDMSRSVRGE